MTDPSFVEVVRQDGRFAIRDRVAGYIRYLEPWELTRLAAQAVTLIHHHQLCEGDIPDAPPRNAA